MKLVLKILALPVLFVVKLICILGNLLTNIVSYVIGLLLLVIGGSAIYCVVKALWQSLAILVVLGIATIAAVFLLVWALDSPGRPNRRNFARGFLAARVIAWAVFFVLTFVLFLIMAVASPAFYY